MRRDLFSSHLHLSAPGHIQTCRLAHHSIIDAQLVAPRPELVAMGSLEAEPCQGTGTLVRLKTPPPVTETVETISPSRYRAPLPSPEGWATIKGRPTHQQLGLVNSSHFMIVILWNAMDSEIPKRTANGSSVKLLLRFLFRLSRNSRPSTYFSVFTRIYLFTRLFRRKNSDVLDLYRGARTIARFVGPFVNIRTTFVNGSQLTSTLSTPPEAPTE